MTGPNTSSAVMQQRNKALDKFDDFPTPMWATRALCKYLTDEMGYAIGNHDVEEPCANRGYMVHPLTFRFRQVHASDIFDYGMGYEVEDYLFKGAEPSVDWTVANPPFRLAEQFIHHALKRSRFGVCMFVRSAFEEGIGRYNRLFNTCPPTRKLVFTERVVIHKGKVLDPDVQIWHPKANGGEGAFKRPTSATAYCWMIWDKRRLVGIDQERTETDWLPPCRQRLTRAGDYDVRGVFTP